jgi:hypothetical protein
MRLEYIEASILRLCKQPRTFKYITQSLNGCDPIQIKNVLSLLEEKNILQKKQDLWSLPEIREAPTLNFNIEDPQLYLKKYMGYFDFLKTPHPLDFEWRNSTASLNYLINLIQEINTVNDKILLLGMPTLFAAACVKDIPQKVTLIERNKPIIKGLSTLYGGKKQFKIIEGDIFTISCENLENYFSVVMDPPWYSPHFYQFMWLAAKCVKIGGIVAISLPPLNTRPNIENERIDWFDFCRQQGLCLEGLYPQKLNYAMPFFEFNAFRAAGIESMSPFWRKGDLAILRKVKIESSERPKNQNADDSWVEREFDNIRYRVKIENANEKNDEISISHLVRGDILPTVSTRDERRAKANIWTSGNRIFKVNDCKKFLRIIDDKSRKKSDNPDLVTVNSFLETITTLEKREYNDYLNWLYLEMEEE